MPIKLNFLYVFKNLMSAFLPGVTISGEENIQINIGGCTINIEDKCTVNHTGWPDAYGPSIQLPNMTLVNMPNDINMCIDSMKNEFYATHIPLGRNTHIVIKWVICSYVPAPMNNNRYHCNIQFKPSDIAVIKTSPNSAVSLKYSQEHTRSVSFEMTYFEGFGIFEIRQKN
jgi:hypothetical protein